MNLSFEQKSSILKNIAGTIRDHFFNPKADLPVWIRSFEGEIPKLAATADPVKFQRAVEIFLQSLNSSHVAFFHENGAQVPIRFALHATVVDVPVSGESRWAFLDVLPGGIAQKVGILPGELLLGVNGEEAIPPELPRLALGRGATLTVAGRDGTVRKIEIELPRQADKSTPPLVVVPPVTHRRLEGGIGYVAINSFPGDSGVGFAHSLDTAIHDLTACTGMVFDLRANIGGGLGSLRLMSYFCPDRVPIGYNLSRRRADRGYRKEKLVRIDRIPYSKLDQIRLFIRFKYLHKDRSIALYTEGLGAQRFHRRIAIIVNDHTRSAAEMVADFAAKHNLAIVVGSRTGGEVLGAVNFTVGEGYMLRIPIGGWITWDERMLEREGVTPHVIAKPTLEDLRNGRDVPLVAAQEAVREMVE